MNTIHDCYYLLKPVLSRLTSDSIATGCFITGAIAGDISGNIARVMPHEAASVGDSVKKTWVYQVFYNEYIRSDLAEIDG